MPKSTATLLRKALFAHELYRGDQVLEKSSQNFENLCIGVLIFSQSMNDFCVINTSGPVAVTDCRRHQSFLQKQNEDNKTVAAVDLLVPGVGEMIGGSQREGRTVWTNDFRN